jgi:hypothetical protein
MSESLRIDGLTVRCETCDGEIEFGDTAVATCRACGIAFLIDEPEAFAHEA